MGKRPGGNNGYCIDEGILGWHASGCKDWRVACWY